MKRLGSLVSVQVLLSAVVVVGVAVGCNSHREDRFKVDHLDRLGEASYDEYATGTIHGACAALEAEIAYIHSNREDVGRSRRVDQMLITLNARLAYLLLHTTNGDRASTYLNEAYAIHTQLKGPEALSRQEFMAGLLVTIERLDELTGSAWKTNIGIDPDSVVQVKHRFVAGD